MRKFTSGWPAVAYEGRRWERDVDQPASRRQRLSAQGEYQAAIAPLIADVTPLLSSAVLSAADDASRELARFDSAAGHFAAPFTSILLRTESASSSEVENITSSAKQVGLAELEAATSPNAALVVANVRAMNAALDLADDINEDSLIQMQAALLEATAPQHTGRFRTEQVWIGGGSYSPHNATFIPPHHEHVATLMADLTAFCARVDIPVLVHAALAHAQFETIHPFPDGNGRTGRALIQSMLRHGGVTTNVAVPVSAGLLSDVGAYFDALSLYRQGDPEAIVTAVTEATFEAVANATRLVDDLNDIRQEWHEVVPARAKSTASRMYDLLLSHPVINIKLIASELGVSETAAQSAVDAFVNRGVLHPTNAFKRNRIWHAPDVLSALDDFGSRARRNRVG